MARAGAGRLVGIGIGAGVVATGAIGVTGGWSGTSVAHTTSQFVYINLGDGDLVANHDLLDQTFVNGEPPYVNNVDWPIDMIYWNNADVPGVKSRIRSASGQFGDQGSQMRGLSLNTGGGAGWTFDPDGGIKNSNFGCITTPHQRIYADSSKDYNYNATWGKYVFASSHRDVNESGFGGCTGYHQVGWSENMETIFGNWMAASGYTVGWDAVNFQNQRIGFEGANYWQNSAYATKVRIP